VIDGNGVDRRRVRQESGRYFLHGLHQNQGVNDYLDTKLKDYDDRRLIDELSSNDARIRELAAAYLGDHLIFACDSGRDHEHMLVALAQQLVRENDPTVQEEIAHSLAHVVERGGQVPDEVLAQLAGTAPHLSGDAHEHVIDVVNYASTWMKDGSDSTN
jgi:hypothetical protein